MVNSQRVSRMLNSPSFSRRRKRFWATRGETRCQTRRASRNPKAAERLAPKGPLHGLSWSWIEVCNWTRDIWINDDKCISEEYVQWLEIKRAHTHTHIYIVEILDSGLNMGPDKWGCFNIFPRVNTGDPQSTKAKTYFRKNAPQLFISGSMGLGLEKTLPLQTLQL